MAAPSWLGTALLILVIASLPSVAWFFWMRRVMLRRQSAIIRGLEERLQPRDKQYWLIGYLVGFAARYTLRDPQAPRIWVTYTTPPYHVFFYLPVIILGRKRERLEVAVEPSSPRLLPGTAYVYRPLIATIALRIRKVRSRGGRWREGSIKIKGVGYRYLHNSKQALDLAVALAQKLEGLGEVQMVFVDAAEKTLGASLGIQGQQDVPRTVENVVKAVKTL